MPERTYADNFHFDQRRFFSFNDNIGNFRKPDR